jgi:hypothetical protein
LGSKLVRKMASWIYCGRIRIRDQIQDSIPVLKYKKFSITASVFKYLTNRCFADNWDGSNRWGHSKLSPNLTSSWFLKKL